ncbi:hypothetical protein EMIT0357P_120059 [Pseudomonas marginalis]
MYPIIHEYKKAGCVPTAWDRSQVIDSDRIEGKKLALALKSGVGICYPMAQKMPHWWAEVTSRTWVRCFCLRRIQPTVGVMARPNR